MAYNIFFVFHIIKLLNLHAPYIYTPPHKKIKVQDKNSLKTSMNSDPVVWCKPGKQSSYMEHLAQRPFTDRSLTGLYYSNILLVC